MLCVRMYMRKCKVTPPQSAASWCSSPQAQIVRTLRSPKHLGSAEITECMQYRGTDRHPYCTPSLLIYLYSIPVCSFAPLIAKDRRCTETWCSEHVGFLFLRWNIFLLYIYPPPPLVFTICLCKCVAFFLWPICKINLWGHVLSPHSCPNNFLLGFFSWPFFVCVPYLMTKSLCQVLNLVI